MALVLRPATNVVWNMRFRKCSSEIHPRRRSFNVPRVIDQQLQEQMIFEPSDACQKDCGNCFRKSLIPWTAVADLSLGQNHILSAHCIPSLVRVQQHAAPVFRLRPLPPFEQLAELFERRQPVLLAHLLRPRVHRFRLTYHRRALADRLPLLNRRKLICRRIRHCSRLFRVHQFVAQRLLGSEENHFSRR